MSIYRWLPAQGLSVPWAKFGSVCHSSLSRPCRFCTNYVETRNDHGHERKLRINITF